MCTYKFRVELSKKIGIKSVISEKNLSIPFEYKNFYYERNLNWFFEDNLPGAIYKCEIICRYVFERIIFPGYSFPSIKHPNMKSPFSDRFLTLDGYNEELKVAFEHDGDQHIQSDYIKALDKEKDKYCIEFGIILIRIPQLFSSTKIENLVSLILNQLLQNGLKLKIVNSLNAISKIIYDYILKVDQSIIDDKLIEIKEVFSHIPQYCIEKYFYITEGTSMRIMVKIREKSSQRIKTFRYTNKIIFAEKVINHFESVKENKIVPPSRKVINIRTGEIFNSMVEGSKSIGKPIMYLADRLIPVRKTGKPRVKKNDSGFELYNG